MPAKVHVKKYTRRRVSGYEPSPFEGYTLPRRKARRQGFVPGARVESITEPGRMGVVEETKQWYMERLPVYGEGVNWRFSQRKKSEDTLFVRWDDGTLDPVVIDNIRRV